MLLSLLVIMSFVDDSSISKQQGWLPRRLLADSV